MNAFQNLRCTLQIFSTVVAVAWLTPATYAQATDSRDVLKQLQDFPASIGGRIDSKWLQAVLDGSLVDHAREETSVEQFQAQGLVIRQSDECNFISKDSTRDLDAALSLFIKIRNSGDAKAIERLQDCYKLHRSDIGEYPHWFQLISLTLFAWVQDQNVQNGIHLSWYDSPFEVDDPDTFRVDLAQVYRPDLLLEYSVAILDLCSRMYPENGEPQVCFDEPIQFDIAPTLLALDEPHLSSIALLVLYNSLRSETLLAEPARLALMSGDDDAAMQIYVSEEARWLEQGKVGESIQPQFGMAAIFARRGNLGAALHYTDRGILGLQHSGISLSGYADSLINFYEENGLFETSLSWRRRGMEAFGIEYDSIAPPIVSGFTPAYELIYASPIETRRAKYSSNITILRDAYGEAPFDSQVLNGVPDEYAMIEQELFDDGMYSSPGPFVKLAIETQYTVVRLDAEKVRGANISNLIEKYEAEARGASEYAEMSPDEDRVALFFRLLFRSDLLTQAGVFDEADITLLLADRMLDLLPIRSQAGLRRRISTQKCYLAFERGEERLASQTCLEASKKRITDQEVIDTGILGINEARLAQASTKASSVAFLRAQWDVEPTLNAAVFGRVQETLQTTVSEALVRATVRSLISGSNSTLRDLIRKRDDLESNVVEMRRSLYLRSNETSDESLYRALVSMLNDIRIAELELLELEAKLHKDAAEYFQLVSSEVVSLRETQHLLKSNESVLLVAPTIFGTHVVAVSAVDFAWHYAPITIDEINEIVDRLRIDLDPTATHYDRELAYKLYDELVQPVLPILAEGEELFIIPGGSLASLPFGVLVTETPEGDDGNLENLRDTYWFSDKFAITQLPSLHSLSILRGRAASQRMDKSPRTLSFVGFGDPILTKDMSMRGSPVPDLTNSKGISRARSLRSSSGIADVDALRGLPSLPATNVELRNLAAEFGASNESLYLREANTETTFRDLDLSGIEVITIATHGIMAGEYELGEPGLVFTPPKVGSLQDDGFLAASEILALQLNAEWLILSACNTAAGASDDEIGLSGLAQSFLYSGARTLLVSHWPVRDDVASDLTVTAIREWQANPEASKSKALARAMRIIRHDPDDPTRAHPSAWGPFSVVGYN